MINQEIIDQSLSYEAYANEIANFQQQGKTSGIEQSQSRIEYTSLNAHRMKRWEKTFQLNSDLWSSIDPQKLKDQIWLVLTESWCGDAAQNLPIIQKITAQLKPIEMRFVYRDQHPNLMDEFLTNGTRSIPKLICIQREDFQVIATWGPRPVPAQELLKRFKADPSISNEQFKKDLHLWYARDKGRSTEHEIFELIQQQIKS